MRACVCLCDIWCYHWLEPALRVDVVQICLSSRPLNVPSCFYSRVSIRRSFTSTFSSFLLRLTRLPFQTTLPNTTRQLRFRLSPSYKVCTFPKCSAHKVKKARVKNYDDIFFWEKLTRRTAVAFVFTIWHTSFCIASLRVYWNWCLLLKQTVNKTVLRSYLFK